MLQEVIGVHLVRNYVILILLHSINSSFTSPTHQVLEKSEVVPSKLKMKLKDASEAILNFFRPVTCRHKEKGTLVPCAVGGSINRTECLENKCCPSKDRHELACYVPFKDNLQLTFRLFVLGAVGFFILGCLPSCCCVCLQRSPCVNPLRRANKEIEKIVRKKRARSEDMHRLLPD
ncbi:FMR1 neighbor protein [Cygnus atratus]|uniref:FMR1 neighbor protein n=1 Tax=Cygnus atratus TaxID=8868 RepID=UPI0021B7F84C|nr:FMR1 neighbor protein [Cygnus atratus]